MAGNRTHQTRPGVFSGFAAGAQGEQQAWWWLLLSNLLTIVMALVLDWRVSVLMWVYWGQSLVIGCFNVRRILALQHFSTTGFRINHHAVDPVPATRNQVALFFTVHYGMFHVVYLLFMLRDSASLDGRQLIGILACLAAFYLNHRYSARITRVQDRERVPNIGNIMFIPYVRIIPMHMMILAGHWLGDNGSLALLLFLVLKTIADLGMHGVTHAMERPVTAGRQNLSQNSGVGQSGFPCVANQTRRTDAL